MEGELRVAVVVNGQRYLAVGVHQIELGAGGAGAVPDDHSGLAFQELDGAVVEALGGGVHQMSRASFDLRVPGGEEKSFGGEGCAVHDCLLLSEGVLSV